MSSLLPIKRLKETRHIIAFQHPQPSYPVHILLMPKNACSSLLELSASDPKFLQDLLAVVQELIVERQLDQTGYRLIVNGGSYQDIPQLHFHLVSGQPCDSCESSPNQ